MSDEISGSVLTCMIKTFRQFSLLNSQVPHMNSKPCKIVAPTTEDSQPGNFLCRFPVAISYERQVCIARRSIHCLGGGT